MSDKRVYLLVETSAGAHNPRFWRYKIGLSKDPHSRVTSLVRAVPYLQLSFVAVTLACDQATELERHLLATTEQFSIGGEWRTFSKRTLEYVLAALAEVGIDSAYPSVIDVPVKEYLSPCILKTTQRSRSFENRIIELEKRVSALQCALKLKRTELREANRRIDGLTARLSLRYG